MAAVDLRTGMTEAVQAATTARDMIPHSWADSWKNFVTQYGLATQANQHEIEMWNLQNEYNTPAAQMARFKEAGLNPMLVYSQGNPGNASHAPQVHVPNAQVNPDADRIQRLNAALSVISAFNDMVGQAMGVADAGLDLQLKRNQVDWSNYETSVAAHHLLGFGAGSRAGQHGWLGTQAIESYLDPTSPDFDPSAFGLLQKLGIPQYFPRQITAEANAALSHYRQQYQDYYNKNILPKLSEYQQGKISIQDIEKSMLDYQDQALEMLPPQIRGILEPVLRWLTPILNGLLRRSK